MTQQDRKALIEWYGQNHRRLPWRQGRDPYRIWISEVMLQQTTTQAVLPYYERFLKRFPDVITLAKAPVEDVLESWSGLGYYSRARNLHKAAQALHAQGEFPKTAAALEELPGFGPYTSRAVSSLAFSESVGVLDGNVIRVISRKLGQRWRWWEPRVRKQLQDIADQWVQGGPSEILNQAFMELGATVCIPQNPKCVLCPWMRTCVAFKAQTQNQLPLAKPRRAKEIWLWRPQVPRRRDEIMLVKNLTGPFLKNQWIFPGEFQKLSRKPERFDYTHTITHHEIYVQVLPASPKITVPRGVESLWLKQEDLKKFSPTSFVRKALQHDQHPRPGSSSSRRRQRL